MEHTVTILGIVIFIVSPIMFIYTLKGLQNINRRQLIEKLNSGEYIEGYVTNREDIAYSDGIIFTTLKHEYFIEIDNQYRFRVNSLTKYNALPLHQKCKVVTKDEDINYIEGYTKLEGRGMFEFLKE
ncbi:TPA: hypothetical protein PRL34_001961 [Staphylococcus aureus]|nr:hypothetical protein [Staphylococcus epidermidis]HDJ7348105.1 hypothetical protein [Staphylococcus aureus]